MKKVYELEELDCANCAAKMETAINKIDGVKEASINFMAMKMTIEVEDERFDEIMQEVLKKMRKVEKDIVVKEIG